MIEANQLRQEDVRAGEQVRLCPPDDAAFDCVLATVPDEVFETETWNCEAIYRKLRVDTGTNLEIEPFAPHPEYTTREEAERHDEFVEYLETVGPREFVATAPHGGWIEYGTEHQSRLVADRLDATDWGCVGFNSGGGAYDRWHVTSTEISRRSFPKLNRIADREFTYAVSFHGFGEDGIAVGGGASEGLKQEVLSAIDEFTGETYDTYIPPAGHSYAGTSPENFVNWLAADGRGIQIEQSMRARREDGEEIADAVASVFDAKL